MAAISITEVTEGLLTGTGAFDKIMSAMQIRLEEEFSQGRITGDDYANVYLGAMTASMQQAVAFVLGRQASDTQAELTKTQALEIIAQTALVGQQKVNLIAEGANIPKQGALLDAQLIQATADTANKGKEGQVLDVQKLKSETENLLLKHKIITESAQYGDSVTNITGSDITVTGVIGKQNSLYAAQTNGFARDAEQKLAKLVVDTWNVRRTTDSGLVAPTGLTDADILTVINKAKLGIGL
jgi:hypothetical protein